MRSANWGRAHEGVGMNRYKRNISCFFPELSYQTFQKISHVQCQYNLKDTVDHGNYMEGAMIKLTWVSKPTVGLQWIQHTASLWLWTSQSSRPLFGYSCHWFAMSHDVTAQINDGCIQAKVLNIVAHGQSYVALSRVRTMWGVIATRLSRRSFKKTEEVDAKHQRLRHQQIAD